MSKGLSFFDMYYDGKTNIYFFANEINGLFKMDISTKEVYFLLSVKEYPLNQEELYTSVEYINNKLVFSPQLADDIFVYDIDSNTYTLYTIEEQKRIEDQPKFYSSCVYGSKVFMFPSHYPAIVEFDLNNLSILYHKSWITEVPDSLEYFRWSVSRVGEKIYAPFVNECSILVFDVKSGFVEKLSFNSLCGSEDGFSGICKEGDWFWLSPMRSETVIRWNRLTDEMKLYEIGNRNNKVYYSYVSCLEWKNKIIICPAKDNDLVIINVNNGDIQRYTRDSLGVLSDKSEAQSLIFSIKNICNDIIFLCTQDGHYCTILDNNGELSLDKMMFDFDKCLEDWRNQDIRLKKISTENEFLNVSHLIRML